jgi:uncharacterized protein DUF5994
MTIAPLLEPTAAPPVTAPVTAPPSVAELGARVSFRQPVSSSGAIDAAWWPRSADLIAEVPALLEVLWTAGREVRHVTYNLDAWDPAPRRARIEGHMIRLGGFATSDPLTVTLTDLWGRERIDVLVVPPATDPAVAQQVLRLASVADSAYTAGELLAKAAAPAGDASVAKS